jgi:hypothetical protein
MSLLPKELNYLKSAAEELATIPPDELTDDIDSSKLDAALRERISGLKLRDAVARLTEDSTILKRWLQEAKGHDAVIWIAGYLMRPGPLARQLLAPPPPPDYTVGFEAPLGWAATSGPRALSLTKGKLHCYVMVLDKSGFERFQRDAANREEQQRNSKNPLADFGVWTATSVVFEQCYGQKYLYIRAGEAAWKQVDYLLEVPGGFVFVRVGHASGKDFDETDVEQKFHSLAVIPPKPTGSASSY